MISLSIHSVRSIRLDEPKEMSHGPGSASKFWIRHLNIIGADGVTVSLSLFGDTADSLKTEEEVAAANRSL